MNSKPIETILARNNKLISLLIQKVTWSHWSHCGIVDGDYVIEAVGIPPLKVLLILLGITENSTKYGGVIRTPLAEFKLKYKETKIVYIDGCIDIAREMVDNVKYDAWGLAGLKFSVRVDCNDKVTCSKLIWLCATHTNKDFAYRATPQKILEISRDEP